MILWYFTLNQNNRPTWVFDNKSSVKLNLKNSNLSLPYLALAFKENEDISMSVPIDIVEVNNEKQEIHMALKEGKYTILLDDGIKSITTTLSVK